ncbi:YaaC family protein [Methylocella silvestris]|uniref:YaaC-like Protein n=1 Tax=Methylocella silvestris TaxID=199596 RepID=A0A2J7TCM2_METSI|nr:hypothetical protein [Methylocella silvestris]PNG24526.1 hypothetical protein CR492_18360 [Methylocella silvestris]
MADAGFEMRMRILHEAVDRHLIQPLRIHGWETCTAPASEEGEYIVVTAQKNGYSRSIAVLYTSAMENRHYRALDLSVDHIFTNGALNNVGSYAYGISTPVASIDQFPGTLIEWNKALAPTADSSIPPYRARAIRQITAESPLDAIWARLEQFASVRLAEKLIERRMAEGGVPRTPTPLSKKAEGLAFAIRNGADYFRSGTNESLSRRILSLYYGALALASADMLASPDGSANLDDVEGFTKFGHGLYTVPPITHDFGGLSVGVLASGFYPRWAAFLGHNISAYPTKKAKNQSDLHDLPTHTHASLGELLSAIPELGDLYLEVFDSAPSWVSPHYDVEANSTSVLFGRTERVGSTYVDLVDVSGRVSGSRLEAAGWPVAELTEIATESGGRSFRVRVDHDGHEYWDGALPLHRSAFLPSGTLILPVLAGASEYRTLALVVLYALSIVVRYLPSLWRRVEGGDWDHYLVLIRTAIGVFERVLPEEFLEAIIGERVLAHQR